VLDRNIEAQQARQEAERQDRKESEGRAPRQKASRKASALTATLQTSLGRIVVRLFPDHAPKTVRNFVELAEGGREWTDPATGRATVDKLYDGTIFHRVIPNFMIQGGDPLGSGRGGPGYKFADEIHPDLRFDRPYLLAMANAGPGTNGSQFFITVGPAPSLNGKHTIFGEVIEGADVVDRISQVKTGSQDRPLDNVTLESVTIDPPTSR
jgi:peptidyl-prolyl cis-trans isomerase A (cyclophilin A)